MSFSSPKRLLPSLDRDKGKDKLLPDAAGIVCSQPLSEARTAAPSPDSWRRSSGASGGSTGSSRSTKSYVSMASFGTRASAPAPPPDCLDLGLSPSQQTCWTSSIGGIVGQRAASPGAITRQVDHEDKSISAAEKPSRRSERVNSDPCGSSSRGVSVNSRNAAEGSYSRAPSGSRTPTNMRIAPLSNDQLQSASHKLRQFQDAERPGRPGSPASLISPKRPASNSGSRSASRSGWDRDSKLPDDFRPESPQTPHEGKSKRPARQWLPGKESKMEEGSTPSSSSSRCDKSEDGQRSSSRTHKSSSAATDDSSADILKDFRNRDMRHASSVNPKKSLKSGTRDDSFLSTISESTVSSDSTDIDKKGGDAGEIEVYSENQNDQKKRPKDVLKDFHQLFQNVGEKDAHRMYELLHAGSFDKPLAMQRLIIPVIKSTFQAEQKSFVTVQGAPQSGKTSALALGILGAINADMPGIRAIALSTGHVRDFKKCFDICAEVHPIRLSCFESVKRKVSFAGIDADPVAGTNLNEDMERLCSELPSNAPGMIYGHPSRVLPLLREAPAWGIDLSNVQVLALDDAEDSICQGLMDEVCEVCTILSHFSKQRLRHIILSHVLSQESKSMIRCLRTSLLKQSNLFGIQAHRTQARAKAVNHYYAVAPRVRWPAMLAVLHNALSLPSGIIFDDESADSRARTRVALRSLGVTASVWNALAEQRSGARAAARDGQATNTKGPAFHLMPSDLAVLKVDVPQVRCILHFAVPKRELGIYGSRLMCLEQEDKKKTSKKASSGLASKSLSVLFVEEVEMVREIEKAFHIRMNEVPVDMICA